MCGLSVKMVAKNHYAIECNTCGVCDKMVAKNHYAIECNTCGVCDKMVAKNHYAIECNTCGVCYKMVAKNHYAIECNTCGVCDKMVAKNHYAIECNMVFKWIHLECNKLSEKEYKLFQENINMPFPCNKCMADSIPLLTLDDKQFEVTANGIHYTEETDLSHIFLSQPQL